MKPLYAVTSCCVLLGGLVVTASADIVSGPEKGEKLQPLKVFAATGRSEGKELDLVEERGEKPTVYVLLREWDRPTARFLKVLDGALGEESAEAETEGIWLTDEKQKTRDYLPLAQRSLKLEKTALTIFQGDKLGPDGWNVNGSARVTVVVAAKGKVVKSLGYQAVNETDVKAVREALKAAVAAK